MLRFGANPIILLINNAGYTIEVEIHDGPYNRVPVRGGGGPSRGQARV
jgi:TPP-dependent 2-oxoacid decarboxylase